ncbi:MAG TPA: GTP 3',8-cyclase MoaA [Gemmatimonadales bacterium]|nr:GTP 3',8-cyclase MoaA [Gemmatimonadales bacterium]
MPDPLPLGAEPSAHPPVHPSDRLGRPLRSLRISVTDRCNLRCRYCMPEDEYVWLPRESILSFEELTRLARVFASLGVERLRLTGGEPLMRRDLPTLVRLLRSEVRPKDLALTTNGLLLKDAVASLKAAGLGRITISLDTLRPERAREFSRTTRHADILEGIRTAAAAGFGVKLNAVVIRGFNDDELGDLIAFGSEVGAEVRFIEYMDVGGATRWRMDDVVPAAEIVSRLGGAEPIAGRGSAPAERYRLGDGTTFGIVASTTAPFCADCDRGRLTADGVFLTCLYARDGVDLRGPIRDGASDAELAALIGNRWEARQDRGAEDRLHAPDRGVLVPLAGLRTDPHREMHTRGG